MSEHTSKREGFERAMKWSLIGPPKEAKVYVDATSLPTFYHVMNGQRLDYEPYVKFVEEWRAKSADYKPTVNEFLRDGDRLAARMTGTLTVDGVASSFESFMFAKIDKESGRMEWLIERAIWGPVAAAPEHGVH